MDVDFKLVTYHQPIETPEQKYKLALNRNRTAYTVTEAFFVYDAKTKTIYEAILCDEYRMVLHEKIMLLNGFNFTEMEPENFIRFKFDTCGFYKYESTDFGEYKNNELGIPGLRYAGAYYDFPEYQKRSVKLKSYDLDIIESYVNYLKREQEYIRKTEINLNLRKERRPRRRQFPNLPPYKKPNIEGL